MTDGGDQWDETEERKETDAIEIETITEHQLPEAERLSLEGLDRAKKCETKLRMEWQMSARDITGRKIKKSGKLTETE